MDLGSDLVGQEYLFFILIVLFWPFLINFSDPDPELIIYNHFLKTVSVSVYICVGMCMHTPAMHVCIFVLVRKI